MKSNFAKFIDGTIGSLFIFLAAFAVMRYYTAADLAFFCAISITACLIILFRFRRKRDERSLRLSSAADEMFFDFMFMPSDAPAKALYKGLSAANADAVRRGKGVYLGKTAAFCFFAEQASAADVAGAIAKAKHFGADKVLLLCKQPPEAIAELDGITVRTVCGNDVYALFASLSALPKKQYSQKRGPRFAAFSGMFASDKIARYIMLSATLGFVAYVGRSAIPFVFSIVAALLALASCVFTARRKILSRAQKNS